MLVNFIFCLVIRWCLKFPFQNISPVCQQVTFRNPCWTELWEFQARRLDCKAQQTLLMHNGLEVSLLMLKAANIIALSEKKIQIFIHLLERFVWHHTSLNFVHTMKSPWTACRGSFAFVANASSLFLLLLGIETYCSSKRDIYALAQRGDSGPRPQLHAGWRTPA